MKLLFTSTHFVVLYLLATLLSLPPSVLRAQTKTHTVQGKVLTADGIAASYATIILQRTNSSEQQTKFADESGHFIFGDMPTGSYILQVSMVGYLQADQEFTISSDLDLGTIQLEQDPNVLEEISVTARRPTISRKRDRLVMNVENMVSAAGRSSMELLGMAPGVFIMQGNISINGVSGTRVMVDGRMLNITGDELKDFLRNLKAEDVQSIEVIARPPAEYEAAGSGGLINIILKKRRETGLQARIGHDFSQGLGRYASFRPFGGISYNSGKVTLTADYSHSRNKSFEDLAQQRTLSGQGQFNTANNSIERQQSDRVRLSGIYDISKNHFLAVDYTGRFSDSEDSVVSHTSITYADPTLNTTSTGDFPMRRPAEYHNVGVNYTWTTDTVGSTFRVIADYTSNSGRPSSGTHSQTFGSDGGLVQDTSFLFRFPSTTQIFTAETKYQKKWTNGWDFQVGARMALTDIDNTNAYDIQRGMTWVYDQQAFDYLYREQITAGFASLSGEVFGAEFNLGLRGENSDIRGEVRGDGQDTIIHSKYFNLFPTLFLQRALDQQGKHVLTLSANRRIQRPSYRELNPYRYFLDNYSIVTGNPLLRPQITHGGELAYLLKQRYYVGFSYNHTKDVIYQVIETNPDSDILLALRKNTGKQEVFTVTMSAPVQFTKWWSSSNNLLLTSSTSVAQEFDLHLTSFVFQSEQEFSLPKGWSASLSAMYTPRVLQGNIITGHISSVDVGVRKRFFNDRLTAAASISDIFYMSNFSLNSYYNDDVIRISNLQQTRQFSLSLTYNINIGKAFKVKSLMKSSAEESGRL